MSVHIALAVSIGLLAVVATWLFFGLLAVGIGAASLVLAAHIPLLSTIPSGVFGFASIAGLILLGKDMSPMNAIVPTIVSILLGASFGWPSEFIGGKLTKSCAPCARHGVATSHAQAPGLTPAHRMRRHMQIFKSSAVGADQPGIAACVVTCAPSMNFDRN